MSLVRFTCMVWICLDPGLVYSGHSWSVVSTYFNMFQPSNFWVSLTVSHCFHVFRLHFHTAPQLPGVPFPQALEKRNIIPGVKPHLKVYVLWQNTDGKWVENDGNQRTMNKPQKEMGLPYSNSTCPWFFNMSVASQKTIGKSSTNGIKWAIRQAILNYSTKGYPFQDANHWLLEAPAFPMEGQGMHGKQTTTYKQPYQVQQ